MQYMGIQPLSFPLGLASEDQPLTIVHYHCSPNQSTSFIQAQSFGTDQPLQIWVESPCACANACAMGDLGPGTIFLIILSLSATAYFILGKCNDRHCVKCYFTIFKTPVSLSARQAPAL